MFADHPGTASVANLLNGASSVSASSACLTKSRKGIQSEAPFRHVRALFSYAPREPLTRMTIDRCALGCVALNTSAPITPHHPDLKNMVALGGVQAWRWQSRFPGQCGLSRSSLPMFCCFSSTHFVLTAVQAWDAGGLGEADSVRKNKVARTRPDSCDFGPLVGRIRPYLHTQIRPRPSKCS